MRNWMTPEEMEREKARKKALLTISIPFLTILITAFVTVLLNKF